MNAHRLAVAAAVVVGLLASSAQAGGTVALDGTKRTHARFSGSLTEPAVKASAEAVRADPNPHRDDCTKASCDITTLRLTLPRGTSYGRFVVTVEAERALNVAVFLYDAAGTEVAQADVEAMDGAVICCDLIPRTSYTRGFVAPRIPAGRYTLVVYDRAGIGPFTTDVEFKAHPPDRPRKR